MSSATQKGFESLPDAQMVEVSKDFFFEGMPLPAAIYLKIRAGSYLLIGKKGDKAAFSNLHAFNHQASQLYVHNLEYASLIHHITVVTTKVVTQKNVPDAIKVRFLSGLAADAMDTLEKTGFTSVSKVQKVSQLVFQMSQNAMVFSEIMAILEALPNNDSRHAMTTALVGMVLCEEMKVTLPLAQEKVAMAALLHDVGLRFVPKAILDKAKHLWSQQELEIYEQHPIKGVEMLRDIKDLPSDVLIMIVEHHENSQGTGFPKKLRDVKISPLGKILGLADFFAELLINSKEGGKSYSADQAVQYIEEVIGQPYNKQIFIALKNVINKKHLQDRS
jgi:putative nucleotidyltransferase with HDIG domain